MAEIIVALDLPTHTAALGLVDELGDAVSWYKVGSPLFTRSGPAVIRQLRDRGRKVFLDLKFHDIPSTVMHAVESAASHDVQMLTLHASGGHAMLSAAASAVSGADGPRLLAVTVLTSLGAADIGQVWNRDVPSVQDEVLRLGAIARDAGLHGVVASPLETEALRAANGPDFLIVNPGIRPMRSHKEDQVRTATPAGAARAGANFLVIGRPILEAEDRAGTLERILAELSDAALLTR